MHIIGVEDYDSGPFTVIFASGITNASFNVTIIDNNQLESNETFYLFINPSSLPTISVNITISDPSQATVTILDDDCKCN